MRASKNRKLVVVTQSGDEMSHLATELKHGGIPVYELPTVRMIRLPLSKRSRTILRNAASYDHIIFTSPHALHFFIEAGGKLGTKTTAVGRVTGDTVKKLGQLRGKKILLPRSAIAVPDLPRLLRKQGARVTTVPLYTTRAINKHSRALEKLLIQGRIGVFTFTSPSTVAGLSKRIKKSILVSTVLFLPAVCIGPRTARAARALGFRKVIVAKTFTTAGIVASLKDHALP